MLSCIVNGQDIGVVELSGCACFLFEAAQAIGVAEKRTGQNFDGDLARQPLITRAIHLAHTTGADLLQDLVVGELFADHADLSELYFIAFELTSMRQKHASRNPVLAPGPTAHNHFF